MLVRAAQARLEVVGGQHRVLADLDQAGAAVRPEIGVRAHVDAGAALVGAHAPDRRRAARPAAPGGTSHRRRARRGARAGTARSFSPTPTGPAPGPPPPCGVENVLWTLKCITSKPAAPGPELAQHGVQVGAVHVGQGADGVDRLQQVHDARLEEAQGRRVGQHHGRGVRAQRRAQRVEVHAAVGGRRHGHRREAGHRCRGGVRAVRRVGHDDLAPLVVAAGLVVGPDHEDAGQLALGAGRRLERHGAHAADLRQPLLGLPQQLQRALRHGVGRQRDAGPRSRAGGRPTR